MGICIGVDFAGINLMAALVVLSADLGIALIVVMSAGSFVTFVIGYVRAVILMGWW